MANATYNDHPNKATPVGADIIPLWDPSAGGARRATINAILNARLTGGGSIVTGGHTLTVPSTGTAALLEAANVFAQNQVINGLLDVGAIKSRTETVAQDAAVSFIPLSNLGMMIITPNFFPDVAGLVVYRAASSGFCSLLAGGGNLEVTTGTLSGTTGNNGKVTISIVSNGGVFIENRRAASILFKFTFIG